MRLQQDLNTSVHESRNLAKQMQTWKEQLSASAADFDDDDGGEGGGGVNAPSFRQEQAYRSVGALQLRVEELTLEVTKVNNPIRQAVFSCNMNFYELFRGDEGYFRIVNVMVLISGICAPFYEFCCLIPIHS